MRGDLEPARPGRYTAAVRLLRYERRWIEEAWEAAGFERERRGANVPLIDTQRDRLLAELEEIDEALAALNDLQDRRIYAKRKYTEG